MNFPRHEFSKENLKYFLEFLKVASDNKTHSACNATEYEKYKKLFPLPKDMKELLKENISKSITVIDITHDEIVDVSSDVQTIAYEETAKNEVGVQLELNESTLEDVMYAIKENLNNEICLSTSFICDLDNLEHLENLFVLLSRELNSQQVSNFGQMLISTDINNETIIVFYVKYLLLEKINAEFTEVLENIFYQLASKFPEVLREEISKYLLIQPEECAKAVLPLLEKLDDGFKQDILKLLASSEYNVRSQ